MPSAVTASADNWWCDESTEYAFMGFSYEVTACQSPDQLQKDFADIRNTFNGRYIRLYGACDNQGFYDDVVNAAWDNGLSVHALIWFGLDWQQRRDSLVSTLYSNAKAKFVMRGIQFSSEPLSMLTSEILGLKGQVKSLGIPVTVSELAYGYQENGGAQNVLDAQDYLNIHILPFFSAEASTSNDAWPIVQENLQFFVQRGGGKKMYFDENGWPSVTSSGVQPNSSAAVADVTNEADYFQLLEDHCDDLKNQAQGGIGWFAHIYSDGQEPGYGIYDSNGNKKFNFAPRTTC
ncbi:glycoside hydrolase family 17 protein [Coniophora puteana RWD-64-598 SS2]|uniref:glucan endo-1,3-beta-D-glucosidase n=1 Tax=Coniophora puteana (strain RWD-64-598) TaxID=741705 RepID=A0A5M3N788_CONPW|nr:glycoside hydrolase family 17 protein [Coniophora puteana RWD-64-598 SS2]EIW86705.1 glycoside hydrolase family 17 protein [Coniophora puteana RWD-64-598 SS2]